MAFDISNNSFDNPNLFENGQESSNNSYINDENGSNSNNNNRNGNNNANNKGYLFKRKDYLGIDENANSHPNRTYYYKRYHNLDEVIDTCTKKLQVDPDNLQSLYLRGSSNFKKGNLANAVEDLTIVINKQPTHTEAIYSRGIAYFKQGQHDQAIRDLSEVLKLNPDHVNAAFARAACYNKMGMLTQAIEDYNFALFKDENSPTPPGSSGNLSPKDDIYIRPPSSMSYGANSTNNMPGAGAGNGGARGYNFRGAESPAFSKSSVNTSQFEPLFSPGSSVNGADGGRKRMESVA
jgi:tetratricopeptide (TPR) repeat protein